MRILVIGGSGFIGRVLVSRLIAEGHQVGVFRREESPAKPLAGVVSIRGNRRRLADRAAELRAFAADVVIDLILSSGSQTASMMDVFRGHTGRIVAITSMDVYRAVGVLHGSEAGPLEPLPLREESALRTVLQTYPPAQIRMLQGIFGWLDEEYDKIPVERVVMGDGELAATVLRLPMVYGPGDRLHRFNAMLRRMGDNRPWIVLPESVASWRSPRGYVENIAAAIALAATDERASRRIYNVAEQESLSELEWARLIADAVGWRGRFVIVPDERAPSSLRIPGNLQQHWVVDSARIRAELGYHEPIPRDESIQRTIAWERSNPAPIDPARLDYEAEDRAALAEGV